MSQGRFYSGVCERVAHREYTHDYDKSQQKANYSGEKGQS